MRFRLVLPVLLFSVLCLTIPSFAMPLKGITRGIETGLDGLLRSPSGVLYTSLDDKTLLSETAGLEMFLALVSDDRERFRRQADLVESLFRAPTDLLYWRLDSKGKPTDSSNASIDDLRICRVLLAASEKWKEPAWSERARRLGQALLTHCTADGILTDGTSWKGGVFGKKVHSPQSYLTLSYGDVPAMLALGKEEELEGWLPVAQRTLGILVLGLNGGGPPYWGYDAEKGRYDHRDDNLINEMLHLLHLVRAGVLPPQLEAWWAVYRESGKVPLPEGGENIAVEALLAVTLAEAGMFAEARQVVQGLERFRIRVGPARGLLGYTEPEGCLSAWAFDNLLALSAIKMIDSEGGEQ